jgi:hypothetical protein
MKYYHWRDNPSVYVFMGGRDISFLTREALVDSRKGYSWVLMIVMDENGRVAMDEECQLVERRVYSDEIEIQPRHT